jgi:hypothetical protein
MSTTTIDISMVGYQARSNDGSTVIGEIEGVRSAGVRVHKIPGHPRHTGYLPTEAIARVDAPTNTVFLAPEVGLAQVLDAPPPPDEGPDDWHKSSEWWADLLGHYGLFDSEGRGNEPFLHADQQ